MTLGSEFAESIIVLCVCEQSEAITKASLHESIHSRSICGCQHDEISATSEFKISTAPRIDKTSVKNIETKRWDLEKNELNLRHPRKIGQHVCIQWCWVVFITKKSTTLRI